MSDEALKHKDHELDLDLTRSVLGRFVYIYCLDCGKQLGNLNITNILDQMELGD